MCKSNRVAIWEQAIYRAGRVKVLDGHTDQHIYGKDRTRAQGWREAALDIDLRYAA